MSEANEIIVAALRAALKEAPRYMLDDFCKASLDFERDVEADTLARHLVGQLRSRGIDLVMKGES